MIRKVLLSTVAIVAISGTAFAADLPSRRAPPVYVPPPVPVFTWTGFYIGGDIGYGFGKDTATSVGAGGGGAVTYLVGKHDGVIGGGHIGYNFSTQSLLGGAANGIAGIPFVGGFGGAGGVIGVEGDITGSNYRGAVIFPGAPGLRESTQQDVAGSVRGRVGIAVDRALFFATGGVAFAQFQSHYSAFGPGAGAGAGTLNVDTTHQRIGWTVGGGVEYAITTNWSLRAEYRYSDFGSYVDNTAAAYGFNTRHKDIVQRATIGFSYKFETPMLAPVVARY